MPRLAPPPRRRIARWLLIWGAVLAAAYLVVFIALWIVQERIVFKLRPLSQVQAGEVRAAFPEARSIHLSGADGTPIHAWYRPSSAPAGPRRLLLYFGANNEQVHWMLARRSAVEAWDLLLVDYRGYGLSGGKPSQAAHEDDAARWLALARTGGDGIAKAERLVVMGTGMGSYMAAHLAARHPVDGVVLVVPYDSALSIAESLFPIYPMALIMRHRFETIAEAPNVRAPTIFFVARRDNFVSSDRPRRLYDAWGSASREWVELSHANHYTAGADPLYRQRLGAFLDGR